MHLALMFNAGALAPVPATPIAAVPPTSPPIAGAHASIDRWHASAVMRMHSLLGGHVHQHPFADKRSMHNVSRHSKVPALATSRGSSRAAHCTCFGPCTECCEGVHAGCIDEHTVVSGDLCYNLAQQNGLTLAQLQSLNPGVDCTKLVPGVTVLCLGTGKLQPPPYYIQCLVSDCIQICKARSDKGLNPPSASNLQGPRVHGIGARALLG